MKRIGLYGGTFDPIHCGHLMIVQRLAEAAELDEVLVMPNRVPPHREGQTRWDAETRLAAVRAAFAGLAGYRVLDRELRRPPPSYTVDTIAELQAEQPQAEWHLMIGGDSAASLASWHRIDELARRVHFLVWPRPGSKADAWPTHTDGGQALRITAFEGPMLELSATEVRARFAAGRALRGFVPEAVEAVLLSAQPRTQPEGGDEAP